jgi:hypothetical protein
MRLSWPAAALCLAFPPVVTPMLDEAVAGGASRHPFNDLKMHVDFYSDWARKFDGGSCCDNHDCYPTAARFNNEAGLWYARRREDGRWLKVPRYVFDPATDADRSPDGRPHLCALAPHAAPNIFYYSPSNDVVCFTPGQAS